VVGRITNKSTKRELRVPANLKKKPKKLMLKCQEQEHASASQKADSYYYFYSQPPPLEEKSHSSCMALSNTVIDGHWQEPHATGAMKTKASHSSHPGSRTYHIPSISPDSLHEKKARSAAACVSR
jgi:hypothetical protein